MDNKASRSKKGDGFEMCRYRLMFRHHGTQAKPMRMAEKNHQKTLDREVSMVEAVLQGKGNQS